MAMTVCLLMFPKGDPLSVKPINSLEQIGRVPSLVTRLTDVHARSDFGLATGECFNADAEFDSTARAAAAGGGGRRRAAGAGEGATRQNRARGSSLLLQTFFGPSIFNLHVAPSRKYSFKNNIFYAVRFKDERSRGRHDEAGRR